MRPAYVGVIGKGRDCPAWVRALAFDTGHALATMRPPVVLICGGLGGVMDASAHGMTASGGVAIGLIPTPGRAVSKHLTYAIRLGLPVLYRDITTAHAVDLAVVLPGSSGTMIEATATHDRGRPLVGVGNHDGWPTHALDFTAWAATPEQLPPLVDKLLGVA
jgi:hypothetical protein